MIPLLIPWIAYLGWLLLNVIAFRLLNQPHFPGCFFSESFLPVFGFLLLLWLGCRVWLGRHLPWRLPLAITFVIGLVIYEMGIAYIVYTLWIMLMFGGLLYPG